MAKPAEPASMLDRDNNKEEEGPGQEGERKTKTKMERGRVAPLWLPAAAP